MEDLKDNISPEAFSNIQKWLADEEYAQYKDEIQTLIDKKDWKELDDAFYTHIRVGTAGVRGKLGAGPNRINVRTIGEAAQGLANFIEDFGQEAKDKGVVVGHEVRKQSREFAELTCSVLAANGIKTFLFDGIRSTPEISFAIRHLKALAGVDLTASHNPRTDNGFKFFWTDGGQVVPPYDEKFMQLVMSVSGIKKMEFAKALEEGFVTSVGKEVDDAYIQKILELTLVPSRSAKIAFSPLNSSGITNAFPALKKEGFDVSLLAEQSEPDENFPGAYRDYINPEFEEVLAPTMKFGEEIGADIAICTDPDGCRFAAAFRTDINSSKLYYFTADEIASAMLHFILALAKKEGKVLSDLVYLKTFTSTTLATDIAKSFGIKYVDDFLVGYKWMGEHVGKMENSKNFVFSFENTCGYCRGDFIRDKGGDIGAVTVAEIVSFLKDKGETLADYLNGIYKEHGYYRNVLYQVEVEGKSGFDNIVKFYKELRANPPKEIGGLPVLKIIDKLPEEARKPENYKAGATGDELTFILSEDEKTRLITRPSGTQPQFKHYIQVHSSVEGDLKNCKEEADKMAQQIEDSFREYQDNVLGPGAQWLKIKSHW